MDIGEVLYHLERFLSMIVIQSPPKSSAWTRSTPLEAGVGSDVLAHEIEKIEDALRLPPTIDTA
ncbi:hypothetical protein GN244_ATG08523 [Phytophthora infestans]|uniref:Uncharacterized protein n=1 Tax=Phytophthora infestans TaxID=4787 RepID=A0A833TAB5_PHYIN|nr:hypothetical protein GN244_ATG08523 [Phytophthora infestans]